MRHQDSSHDDNRCTQRGVSARHRVHVCAAFLYLLRVLYRDTASTRDGETEDRRGGLVERGPLGSTIEVMVRITMVEEVLPITSQGRGECPLLSGGELWLVASDERH